MIGYVLKNLLSVESIYHNDGSGCVKGRHHDHINGEIVEKGQGAQEPVVVVKFIKIRARRYI